MNVSVKIIRDPAPILRFCISIKFDEIIREYIVTSPEEPFENSDSIFKPVEKLLVNSEE